MIFVNYLQSVLSWMWLLAVVALLIGILYIPVYRRTRFFSSIDFRGYDGKFPRFRGKKTVNTYLKRLRFKSKIPKEEWDKIQPELEMFYRRKIYKMEQSREDIRTMYIFLIQENLPSYIEWQDNFMEEDGNKFAIGESYSGKVVWDTTIFPHGLVAGASSTGKTNLLRCLAWQGICKKFNVQIFDFKSGGDYISVAKEAEKYQDLEKRYGPFIISNPEESRQFLLMLTVEASGRMEKFKEAGVSNITEYNARGQEQFLPWLLIADETSEILDVKPKDKVEKEMYAEIDHYLRSLARMGRAAGIHILMGFIRPDSTVLDGQIKNNLLFRCCGYFADPAASRIVLDNDKATELPPEIKGRFIVGEEETQIYYLPIPKTEQESKRDGEDGAGGVAKQEPPALPAEGGPT